MGRYKSLHRASSSHRVEHDRRRNNHVSQNREYRSSEPNDNSSEGRGDSNGRTHPQSIVRGNEEGRNSMPNQRERIVSPWSSRHHRYDRRTCSIRGEGEYSGRLLLGYHDLDTFSTHDRRSGKRKEDIQDECDAKRTKYEEDCSSKNHSGQSQSETVLENDNHKDQAMPTKQNHESDDEVHMTTNTSAVSTQNTIALEMPFEELETKLSELKGIPSDKLLDELTQPAVIHSFTMYLEQENLINVSEIYPIIAVALESRNQEQRSILSNALGRTQFMNREEITSELTDIITHASKGESIRKDEYGFVKSVLDLMLDFINVVRADKHQSYVSLIKAILSSPDTDYIEKENLLKEIQRESDMDFDAQKTNKISKQVHDELRSLADRNILPRDIWELHLRSRLELHNPDERFDNDAHYLRFMFDIYREDFIRPLQTGIMNYMNHINFNQTGTFRDDKVRVYSGVWLGGQRCCFQMGVLQDVYFNRSQFPTRSLGTSFLQYGNLVCLTDKNFSFLAFAMVGFRDRDLLERGLTSVYLITDDFEPNAELVMIESKAFYTAYVHSLKAIQSIARDLYETDSNLPFRQQLVSLERTVKEADYSKNTFGSSKLVSFRCLLKSSGCLKLDFIHKKLRQIALGQRLTSEFGSTNSTSSTTFTYSSVPLLDFRTWPTKEDLGVDSSQYSALQLALTKRLAVIQGPPGTGKTVVGLKIAEFILNNRDKLFDVKKPILLVSYTNHALDQFLNGVLQFSCLRNCHPSEVIRVGSRSEAENLRHFNLNQRMKGIYRNSNMEQIRTRLCDIRSAIECALANIRYYEESLLHETFLFEKDVISPTHYNSLRKIIYEHPKDSAMIHWLDVFNLNTWEEPAAQMHEEDDDAQMYGEDYDIINDEMMREEDLQRMMDDDFIYIFKDSLLPAQAEAALSADVISNKERHSACFVNMTCKQLQTILRRIVSLVQGTDVMNEHRVRRITNVWSINMNDRWSLYRYWLSGITQKMKSHTNDLLQEFAVIQSDYKKAEIERTAKIFMSAKIVALTTTGAAKHMDVLRKIGPSVVMVEEAAHMTEQHVLGCITASTQHLILIGDHQQLKPQANDYQLSRTHHILECSLLERLVKSRVDFVRLSYQHRMSPEISELVCPSFYKDLKDHKSIIKGEKIRGLEKNIVFLDHNEPEATNRFSTSCSNRHEAEFVARLYKYLRQQGYGYQDITILSLYNDQVRMIRKFVMTIERDDSLMARENRQMYSYFQGTSNKGKITRHRVRIISVDNYQGEENKIIILSLVRSNKDGNLGYVKNPNRICVALTRAKIGLYVIGNLSMMKRKNKLWNEIIQRADDREMFQKTLGLSCQSHPNTISPVKKAADFDRYAPDGGCNMPCNFQRDCGHTCDRKCHPLETLFHDLPCTKVCRKILCKLEHRCPKPCNEPCGQCKEKVMKIIPSCGHEVEVPCYREPSEDDCKEKCTKIISCGHKCQRKCGQKCNTEYDCNELVKVIPACGHEIQIACSAKLFPVCTVPCNTLLPCGHTCKGKCGDCSGKRLHIPCEERCERVLICGHTCSSQCSKACPPCNKPCKTKCVHLGASCRRSCIPCRKQCSWKCDKECKNQYRCGKDCSQFCDRPRCNEPCKRQPHQKCKHFCSGICGEPCPNLCKICDKETSAMIFSGKKNDKYIQLQNCGHVFELSSMDAYMDGGDESDRASEIIEKTCPRCKTAIQPTGRYGNVVKKMLTDIDKVKGRQMEKETSGACFTDLMLNDRFDFKRKYSKVLGEIQKFLNKESEMFLNNKRRNETPVLLKSLMAVFSKAFNSSLKTNEKSLDTLLLNYLTIVRWICRQRFYFTIFELQQYEREQNRFSLLADFLQLQQDIEERTQNILSCNEKDEMYGTISDLTTPKKKVKTEKAQMLLAALREKTSCVGMGIAQDENIIILQVLGCQQKGRWYKCKNNHIYEATDENGGEMEKATCPECHETKGMQREEKEAERGEER